MVAFVNAVLARQGRCVLMCHYPSVLVFSELSLRDWGILCRCRTFIRDFAVSFQTVRNLRYWQILFLERGICMTFAYARVSSDDQNLDRQLDAFEKLDIEPINIFKEKITGRSMERRELDQLLSRLRSGDTLYIESLSRLSRSAKDLLSIAERFEQAGVTLISLREQLDSSTPYGRLLFTILASLAQFEREIIVARTKDGLAAARARGRTGGRPKCDPKKLDTAVRMHTANSHSVKEITQLTGISPTSLYRELRRQGLVGTQKQEAI